MLKLEKVEDLRTKCDYCESRSFTVIFEEEIPIIICDRCGLPQRDKKNGPPEYAPGNVITLSLSFPPNYIWYTTGSSAWQ